MSRVRPASLKDLEAIRAVSIRNGLSSFHPDEVRQWWLSHPFRKEFEGVPIGWVLESDAGEVVGTFSNIQMMYELDGKRIKAGVGGSWAVDAAERSSSLLLAVAYFTQNGVDLCLNGSASSVAARLMPALKAERIPSPDYDLRYFWIAGHRAFAAAALRKKKIPAASLLAPVAGLGLWATGLRFERRRSEPPGLKRFSGFSEEFDAFWEKLRQEPGRLRAVRTSAALAWRFGASLRQNRAVVLGLMRGGELRGYVVLLESAREHLRLRQYTIADLQALEDSREVVLDLLAAALEATRREGLDALEWKGWNTVKRGLASSQRPKSYRDSVWPLFYKALHPDLLPVLTQAGRWDFSPFDAF